uniref:Uncharacterized protein n=1 Tax=Guillardia theta TaxID=55529 RepID=A0A7S4KQ21_GUITH
MFLLGQQGTGKYHFAKLYARFLWASGFIKTDGFTQGSMNVSNTWERPTMRLSIGGHEDEHWPLILLRAPKLKGSSPESTANNFRNFLERHRGNVVLLKEIDSLADSVSVEVIKAVVQVIQRFLEEHGDGFTLLVSGRDRNSVGNIFRHYQPAKPTMLRRHFPFVMDFDRYSAEELMEIFRRQCDREQVRLGSTVTEVMLQKAFVLNFNFFDGSNGAGTRHLLMLARLEHGKRGDRREGIFEATDLQAAFQKLRQDWFAAHPERTFAALQYMQQTEKSMESRRRKSIGDDADAINDASAAGAEADLEEEEGESEDDWELQKWTLEDFRIFHDHELKKREEDHHRTLQREREECRMVVEQTNLAHAASLSRFLAALRQVIYQKFFHITGREAFQVWQFGTRRRHLRQHRRKIAQERWSRKVYSIALSEWKEWQRERRMRSRVLSSAVAARKYEAAKESFQLWNRFLWLSREEQRVKATGYERLLSSLVAKQDSFRNSILPDWSDAVNEQINDRELEWEFQRRDAKHADEMYKLTKRHQSEVSEWRKDSEAKLRRQKELRKESEKTLKPLQQWKWKATVFSSILVILYAAPIVPAVTPWVMSTMQQLSLGHWYVGILLVVSLGAAIRRLLKWLYVSVIPSNVKSAYRWARDMELDSHLVGVLIAYFSWLQLCDDGDQAQGQLFLRCKPRISWISKVVVAVSASVMTQEIKVLVAILHRQGIRNVIKATAAKLVPSWFYSLHDHSIPELLAVVQHSNVPPGKKVKACKRIAEFAEGGQERQEHIVHWDGIVILTDVIKSEQNLEVLEAAAEALANMCSSRVVVNSLLEKDGVKILINLLQREKKASITKQCLRCLAQIAESGFLGAEAVLSFPGSSQLITEVLSSRDVETRKQAAKMLSSLASSLFSKPLKDEGMHISKLQKDLRLMEMVQPLVSELQGGWFLRIICLLPDCKACAARSLGFLAGGSSDYVESMVRAGAVQALMKILRLRYRWLYPTESLLRLKADAAFAVAAIAREGDLQRGRLQEAGAIQVLEQLWMGMMHNIDGDVAVLMRDEALKALQAVRGTSNQGSVFRTPPLSGTSTPCISSRNSSPASSPRRRRVTDSAYLRQSL